MHDRLRLPLALAAALAVALAGCSRKAEPPDAQAPPAAQAPPDSAPAPVAPPAVAAPDPSGTWVTDTLPAADAPGRVVTLTLVAGGGARLVTEYVGRGTPPADSGRWTLADDALSIRWLTRSGRRLPRSMVWGLAADTLVPREWDRDALGAAGLTFHRGGAR